MHRRFSRFSASGTRNLTKSVPQVLRDKVFCIGLGRTGTTTFAECMRLLGSHHLGWDRYSASLRRDLGLLSMFEEQLFISYLDKFDSADDYPLPQFYERLSCIYPASRFVLTTRHSADIWAESIIKEFNRKKFNEGENTWYEGDLYAPDRKLRLVRRYEAHQAAVRRYFSGSPRLLEVCWEQGDGWPELCAFLGMSVPDRKFPHFNRAKPTSPQTFISELIEDGRHGKLCLYLKDLRNESLFQHTRHVLMARVNRELDRQSTRQNLATRSIFEEVKQAFASSARRLSAAPKVIWHAIQVPPQDSATSLKLAICAIFRDEARFLDEWLSFHYGVGVERFFLYNDRSVDDYLVILTPWIEKGIVVLHDWPERSQVDAFNDCLQRYGREVQWLAFIDLDEFLYSPTGISVPEILHRYPHAAAVFVYWALFGSSGHQTAPSASVISSYSYCQSLRAAIHDTFDHGQPGTSDHVTGWSRDGKSIVRTAWVTEMNNHQPSRLRYGIIVDENGQEMPRTAHERRTCMHNFTYSTLRLNHYWSKSLDDLSRRAQRGCVFDRSRPPRSLQRLMDREKELNEIYDDSIQLLWQRIKLSSPHGQIG